MKIEERLQLEKELLMTCSKAQAINKYIDELEENCKLSELWCKLQQENQQLKQKLSLVNEMNENNYNKYCETLKQNQQLEDKINRLREILKQKLITMCNAIEIIESARKEVGIDE